MFEFLDLPIFVSTPIGYPLVVDQVYQSYVVTFLRHETRVDLIILDTVNFDFKLGVY